jgi:hypothetical protein
MDTEGCSRPVKIKAIIVAWRTRSEERMDGHLYLASMVTGPCDDGREVGNADAPAPVLNHCALG